ncbi:ATP-binding cassette domain-containing protein [Leucobacter sp. cx-42]|uniref:ATP-binding cassette domain-containing protein n=1 Tax=unclassified Leucobacter TaxID=2621730 RepID=UPI00165D9560|nr:MULTISPECIES: ATP-binding cassette domain-containing protein [unclassified Leucobacter]MBC9953583.1 ATP-binding cassette domain-containing protein [Leucobacter sp. cx-42]
MSVKVERLSVVVGERLVFSDLSYSFAKNELTAVVGPSGSGKTTLLEVIAGLRRPQCGSILINDETVNPDACVWVPQGANALGSRSVLDNVMIAPLSDGVEVEEAILVSRRVLELVGLQNRDQEQAKHLSGGELQRLAFARALASSRAVILADEPTANLDAKNTDSVISLLQALKTKRTMIVATHDITLIEAVDRVLFMRFDQENRG